MKQILFLILFANLFVISIYGQVKPTPTPVKTQKSTTKTKQEITTQKAVTESGKVVILKSNGTWEFAPVQVTEQPKIKPCELTLKDAPVIKGLKLGMTRDEVQKAFGVEQTDKRSPFYYFGAKILPNGVAHYRFYNFTLKELDGFQDISVLELDFFYSEVHSLTVEYSKESANFTNEQFRLKISESFNLPVDGWSNSSLKCAEFEVEVSSGNILILTNLLTSEKIKESEKKKRETFKP